MNGLELTVCKDLSLFAKIWRYLEEIKTSQKALKYMELSLICINTQK